MGELINLEFNRIFGDWITKYIAIHDDALIKVSTRWSPEGC